MKILGICCFIGLLICFATTAEVVAVTLNPGDLVVPDSGGCCEANRFGSLYVINPNTGERTFIPTNVSLLEPVGAVVIPNGSAYDIFVSENNQNQGNGKILRVDPATGATTTVASGSPLFGPYGLVAAPNGDLFVFDGGASGGTGAVFQINPATGSVQSVCVGGVSSNTFFGANIDREASGDILIADPAGSTRAPNPNAKILRCHPNPQTPNTPTVLSPPSGGPRCFTAPARAVAQNGDIYVADRHAWEVGNGLIKVNPADGTQTSICTSLSQSVLQRPSNVTIDAAGNLLVLVNYDNNDNAIVRVNSTTCEATTIIRRTNANTPEGLHSPARVAVVPPALLRVAIDIKPGSFPNSINLGSKGNVPVAIFSTTTFDATKVDPTTVTLASAPVKLKGNGTPMASFQDVNGDTRLDLVVQVSTESLQLSETDTEAVLEGKTFGGTPIRGSDSVRVVP